MENKAAVVSNKPSGMAATRLNSMSLHDNGSCEWLATAHVSGWHGYV